MRTFLFVAFAALALWACSKEKKPTPPPVVPAPAPAPTPPPAPAPVIAKVIFFIAPWCNECRDQFHKVEKAIENKTYEKLVLFETGHSATEPPTVSSAEEWKAREGTKWKYELDIWPWSNYQKYFPTGKVLPAVVALDKDGKVIHKFGPGPKTADDTVFKLSGIFDE